MIFSLLCNICDIIRTPKCLFCFLLVFCFVWLFYFSVMKFNFLISRKNVIWFALKNKGKKGKTEEPNRAEQNYKKTSLLKQSKEYFLLLQVIDHLKCLIHPNQLMVDVDSGSLGNTLMLYVLYTLFHDSIF